MGGRRSFFASTRGREEIVKLLLSHIVVNTRARNGQMALVAASMHGHIAVVNYFALIHSSWVDTDYPQPKKKGFMSNNFPS